MVKVVVFARDDGSVGYRYVADAYTPSEGEVFVDEPPERGAVWDEAQGAPRPKSAAEKLQEVKQAKIDEFQARTREDLVPPFMPRHGVDEAILVLAKTLKAMLEASGQSVPTHITAMVTVGDKALAKKAAIEAATTEEELEAIGWE